MLNRTMVPQFPIPTQGPKSIFETLFQPATFSRNRGRSIIEHREKNCKTFESNWLRAELPRQSQKPKTCSSNTFVSKSESLNSVEQREATLKRLLATRGELWAQCRGLEDALGAHA